MKTIAELAVELSCTPQSIYKAKAKAERCYGALSGITDPADARKVRYTESDIEKILEFTTVDKPVETVPPSVTVETGNHFRVLSGPNLSGSFSLETFRESEAVAFEDPLAVAQQFTAVADTLIGAMGADIRQREERLKQARQAQTAIADKTQELRLEQRLYRERAWMLDSAQTESTQALQSSLNQLQSLGKSPGSSQDGCAS